MGFSHFVDGKSTSAQLGSDLPSPTPALHRFTSHCSAHQPCCRNTTWVHETTQHLPQHSASPEFPQASRQPSSLPPQSDTCSKDTGVVPHTKQPSSVQRHPTDPTHRAGSLLTQPVCIYELLSERKRRERPPRTDSSGRGELTQSCC